MFADVLIVFFVRAVIQIFRASKARHWSPVKAEIRTAEEGRRACLTVELTYQYLIGEELYTGTHTEPFFFTGSLKHFLDECSPGNEIIVRVKPGEPSVSVVRDKDIYFHAHGYRLEN